MKYDENIKDLTKEQKLNLLKDDGTDFKTAEFYLNTDIKTLINNYYFLYADAIKNEELDGQQNIIYFAYFKTYKDLKSYFNNSLLDVETKRESYILSRILRAYLTNLYFKNAIDFFYLYFIKHHQNYIKNKTFKESDFLNSCIDVSFFYNDIIFTMLAIYKAYKNKINPENNPDYDKFFNSYKNDFKSKYIDLFKPTTTQNFIYLFNTFIKDLENLTQETENKQTSIILKDYVNFDLLEHIQITEHTSKDFEKTENKKLKHILTTDIKDEYNRFINADKNKKFIKDFKETSDTPLSNTEILNLKYKNADKNTLFNYMHDLGLDEELEKIGISYITKKDGNKKTTYIETQSNTLTNIMNIEDTQIYKRYGKNTLELKKFIEAQVFTFFRNNNINDFVGDFTIKINPQQFNNYRHIKKDIFLTKEELKDFLYLLSDTKIRINNKENRKGNIWQTPEKKITENKKLTDEIKTRLIQQTHEITIFFNLIQHYIIDKDPETNQETYFIKLTDVYINYLLLVYINNYFITDNTNPITPLEKQPNSKTPDRAKFIKDTILFYMKNDKGERPTLKKDDYTLYTYSTTIYKLKNMMLEANLFNINKLKKDGYTKTIKEPLKEAFIYLLNNNNIEIYPPIENIFIDNKATKKNISIFEAKEISITLKNDN